MDNNEILAWEDSKIEPFTMLHDILSNLWVILLGAIAAALLTNVVVYEQYVPRYTTSATYAVSSKTNANAISNLSATYEMAQTFQAILGSNAMNKIICEELGVDSVDAQISTQILGETNLLTLNVTAGTSKEAIDVIRVVMDNYEKVSYFALSNAMMILLEEPTIPMYPMNPLNIKNAMGKAFVIAGVALILLFGILSYFRDTIKREEDIEKKLDARSLGVISFERKYKTLKEMSVRKKSALLINNPLAGFAFVENYKKLAVKAEYQMKRSGVNAVVVTSVVENEGKSTVAANLAIALAEQSKKVMLIEGDLRRPSQFLIFNRKPEEEQEIGEYLKGNLELKNIIMESDIPNLYYVLGKNCYSSSTEIVNSAKMEKLLAVAKDMMDYVIIDSAPVGVIGDAEILAKYAGSVLLVVKQNYVFSEDINEVLDEFREHHSKVLGVVLNGAKGFGEISGNGYYGKYSRYADYARNRGNE